MKKKTDNPSAFDNMFSNIGYSNTEEGGGVTDMDNMNSTVDVEPNNIDNTPSDKKLEDDETGKTEPPVDNTDDNSDIPQEVLDRMNGKEPDPANLVSNEGLGDENITDDDVTEAQQVGAFFDAVAEKFGWNIDDIKDDKPVTVDEFTQYIQDVVNENSQPQYADDRVAQLDEFIKNGGNFEDFYKIQQQQINYDNIDIEDEVNQKAVISDLLRANGYTDQQILRKLDRYESADMLEEEAEEALAQLKEIKKVEAERTAKEQEQFRIQQEEQNKKFVADVTKQINELSNVRGISIPKEDRRALLDYIFKQDSSGMTQYQKDFNKNLSKNLIESAYFTMRADSFVNEAKKTGQTTAAQKLRQMLRHTSKNHSSYNADEDKQRPAWEIASKFL